MKLYNHSVLCSNKVEDNKLIKNSCEKIILNLFLKAQTEMKEEVENIVFSQFPKDEREEILKALFTGKTLSFQCDLEELKDSLRKKVVKRYAGIQSVNLTKLSKDCNINITKIREELHTLAHKVFEFNYINRKHCPVKLVSGIITGAEFIQENRKLTFNYQIPIAILNFLVFPDQYAPVDMEIIRNLKSKYSIKLYLLALDHRKRGILKLTKEEICQCFSLPKSYSKNRKSFMEKFLNPALKELEEVAKMRLSYDFSPLYSFDEITLKIERNFRVFSEKILEKIAFAKRNIYIKKFWDIKTSEFLMNYYNEKGEQKTLLLLQEGYGSLNEPIKTSLSNYFFVLSKKIDLQAMVISENRMENFGDKPIDSDTPTRTSRKLIIEDLSETEIVPSDFVGVTSLKKTLIGNISDSGFSIGDMYLNFSELDKKVYKNLAKLLFQEKIGIKHFHEKSFYEQAFNASFNTLLKELIEC